jgi:hypothetical protein
MSEVDAVSPLSGIRAALPPIPPIRPGRRLDDPREDDSPPKRERRREPPPEDGKQHVDLRA